jgi:cupin fold WbuC family metalloprotein
MARGIQFIDRTLIDATIRRAEASARGRINHNFHTGAEDNPHRFLNVLTRGSYVAPHRHTAPPKAETFLVLEGHLALIVFDDAGAVTGRYLLGPHALADAPHLTYAGLGIDLAPGVWHTVTAVSDRAVCFEVKPGPWDPATDKEFAPWAPAEGAPGAAAYLAALLML